MKASRSMPRGWQILGGLCQTLSTRRGALQKALKGRHLMIGLCGRNFYSRAGEMTLRVTWLLCKHEDLSFIPRIHMKKAECGSAHLQSQDWGRRDRQISETH